MTKQSNERIDAAKERLRKIEKLLEPYKKHGHVEPYSSRGKWRSAGDMIGETREREPDQKVVDAN